MSKKLKTIDVKGKKYVEVHERLKYFRTNFKNHSLITEVVEKTDSSILIKAVITNEEGKVIATGLAEEVKGSSFINKTSYVENCETSAWGRALGNLGIGLDSAVASYEEVANAKLNSIKELSEHKFLNNGLAKIGNTTIELANLPVLSKDTPNYLVPELGEHTKSITDEFFN